MGKRVYVFLMAALFITWGATQRTVGAEQVWTGVITDSMCRADHGGGEVDPKECTQKCVKNGEQYVLAVEQGQKVISIANQDFGSLFENAGDTVKVSGELKDGAIIISKIERSR
jgi:formylmethanofuran dehydrogenase subunit D